MKLLQRLPSLSVTGRIIIVPGLNFPAFLSGTRTSPIDGLNLNRVFPGTRDGSVTEMIAHYADTELLPRADFVFDIHSGGQSLNHLPTVLVAIPECEEQRQRYAGILAAFAAPRAMIMDTLGEDRTYGSAARRQGKLFLCDEFGGMGTCDPDGLAIVESGLRRVLHTLGIAKDDVLEPAVHETVYMKVEGEAHYVFAPSSGIFEPAVRLGQAASAGQTAGYLFDLHEPWKPPIRLAFRGNGMVMCIRSFAGSQLGDCLVLLASVTNEPLTGGFD